ncbi:hypothetical protein I541_5640 [Mycobacteroides abscessus]|nr:hypothetical protein I541_5640 [Mycobacteroides abscessus]
MSNSVSPLPTGEVSPALASMKEMGKASPPRNRQCRHHRDAR